MRLLLTTDTVGGVWSYTRELVCGLLAGQENSVSLFSLGGLPSPEQAAWLDRMRDTHGERFRSTATDLPLEWQHENSEAYSAAEPLLLQEVDVFQPDILQTSQFCFGALPVSIPKIVVAHSDVLSWHRAVRGSAPEPTPWLDQYMSLVQAGLASAAMVVAPTEAMLHDLQRGFGAQRRGTVIPNGRDIATERRTRRLQAVTAGRVWDAAKDMAVLEDLYGPMPVLVAGATQQPEASYDARRLRRCVLAGSLSERALLGLFAESAVYVATSIYEPFGLTPVEAALSGCAILARSIPSFREVWGDAATYFESAAELKQALSHFASDPRALAEAKRAAGERAKARYSRKAMVHAYQDLYRDLLRDAGHA